jgi:hypothetical protein
VFFFVLFNLFLKVFGKIVPDENLIFSCADTRFNTVISCPYGLISGAAPVIVRLAVGGERNKTVGAAPVIVILPNDGIGLTFTA